MCVQSTCNVRQPESNNAPKRATGRPPQPILASRQWRHFAPRLPGCSRCCRCCGQKRCHFDHFLPAELRAGLQQSDPDSLKSQPAPGLAGLADPSSRQVQHRCRYEGPKCVFIGNPTRSSYSPSVTALSRFSRAARGRALLLANDRPHRLANS